MKCVRLHRVKFAFLDVKDLRAGEYRRLKPYEIKQLNRLSMEGEQNNETSLFRSKCFGTGCNLFRC